MFHRISIFTALIALVPAFAGAADGNRGDHHLAPLLDQIMSVNRAVPVPACADRDDAGSDSASARIPSAEPWRRGAVLPTLITAKLLTYRQVCEDARAKNRALEKAGKPTRPFALVLAKMHLCDSMSKVCIHTARTFFDPCNKFITENFVPYHARTYFDGGKQPPAGDEMVRLYEMPSGPRFTAIDLDTCLPLKHAVEENGQKTIETGIQANSDRKVGEEYAWSTEDRLARFADMRAQLRELLSATPGAAEKIGKSVWEKDPATMGCSENESIPLLPNPLFIPQLRMLMNEQYRALTGTEPPVKVRWPASK